MNGSEPRDDHLVFVYGSLKRGFYNHRRLQRHAHIADVVTEPCFALYRLGRYPGMVRTQVKPHEVRGELWQVDPQGLLDLDRLEVNGRLFGRELIPVRDACGHCWQAWAYLYLGDVSNSTEVGCVWK
jgi:gamma-glutamylcyclotransferase (GGCT)/AIG2-like uncharacterized protein YtfP